jgi:2-dehydropantoate 2-reductase
VAEASIQRVIWKKAIINCVFNSVCPLLETDNGIFYRNGNAKLIAQRIIAEGIEVASTKGIVLDPADVLNSLLMVSKFSDGQLISTYQDILNKRPTEIETLNFAIAGAAAAAKKEDAAREIRFLGELIALKSALATYSHTPD